MGDIRRPGFHFTPPANWMNDPNGLVYFDGEYHLFYQHYPHSPQWGPMHWGHAVSRDLVNWQHLPIALHPDEHGFIFSGSVVVDWKNTAGFGEEALVAIFTYNKKRVETQNLAYSTDRGRTWTKYTGNPVIPNPGNLRDFRDPKVFWYEDHWVMALAAGNIVLFYASKDLKHWEQSGSFGDGYGSTDGIWETPDLFPLVVDDTGATCWVLTVGVYTGAPAGGSGTQYFIGEFDGKTFLSENSRETVLWADYGADYYAPQTWNNEPNERRIMLGWMSNWQYAREAPEYGWRGAFSLPRELSLVKTPGGFRLAQQPIRELKSLREEEHHWRNVAAKPGENLLANLTLDTFEIVARIQHNPSLDVFGFHLRKSDHEHTTVGYNPRTRKIFLDRTRSGQVDFKEGFAAVHSAHLEPEKGSISLHIFVERCSVEVFANNGIITLSDLIYPSARSLGLEFFTMGGEVHLDSLDLYRLTCNSPCAV
ncbi:MAG: glycoside hydrolase family 32 protein [Chloroflexota bacterium]